MLPKIQARIQHWHHRWAVRWIHTVLSWPRSVLLVPAILVFVAAYAVVYEFSIKHLNARVSRYVHPHQHPHSSTAHQVAATRPRWMYHLRYAAGGDGGVLTPAVLQEVHRWEAALAPAVVVSPLSGWAMAPVSATPVLKYINYDMSPALQRMFFDNITNENHLLTAAAVVDVYVVSARPVAWAEAQANPGAHTGTSTRSTRESESTANKEDTEANDNEGRESQDKHQDKLGSDLSDNQQTKEPNHKEKEKDQKNDPSQSEPGSNNPSLHSGTDTSGTGTSDGTSGASSHAGSSADPSPIAASARIPGLRLLSVAASADPGLLRQFVGFYATEAGTATAAAWVSSALGWAVLCALGAYHVYVYLCLTNQHKLFCTSILMMCWITQTLLVASSSINVVEAAGLTRDEPTSVANMLLYVFVVTLAMSPSFFAGVGLLTDNYAESFPVHKRLYWYYSSGVLVKRVVVQVARLAAALAVVKVLTVLSGVGGVSGGVSGGVGGGLGDISSSSSYSSPSSSPSSPSSLHPSFAAPATLLASGLAKLDRLLVSLVVASVVDFVLGATFMAAAIVVDVKRTVDRVGEPLVAVDSDDEAVPEDAMASANPVSRFLARRNPGWSQWFVTVGSADHDGLRVAALAGLVVAMIVHWLVVVPHRLAREGGVALVGEFDFGSSGSSGSSSLSSSSLSAPPWVRIAAPTPLRSSHTWLYYIELASIVMFVSAIALIIFRLTFPRSARDDAPHDDDFVEPQRQFNTIDLETKPGTLDIISIKTNCHTSFIVTISLDRTICIWSPLSPGSPPITISPTEGEEPFWPVNHVNISDDGNYVVLFNFRAGVARCFERKQLRFSWESPLPGEIRGPLASGARVLESFFRRRTVPGFLARKVMQKKHRGRVGGSRRGSAASLTSVSSAINGNFPETDEMAKLQKEEMVVVVESGHLVTVSCQEGAIKVQDMLKVFEGERGGNEPRVGGNESKLGGNEQKLGGNESKLAGLSPNRAGLGHNEQKLGGLTPESAILSENDPVLDHSDPRLTPNDPSLTQNHSSSAQNDPRLTPTNPGLTPNDPALTPTTPGSTPKHPSLPGSTQNHPGSPDFSATPLAQTSSVASAPAKHLKLLSAKKLVTPRINDRIVCQVGTHPELLVATVVNNNWKFRKLPVRSGHYNQAAVPVAPMSPAQGFNKNDFAAMHRSASQSSAPSVPITDSAFSINRPTLVTMEFVGMVVRVKNMSAELVDIASGTVLKTFNVGRFKPQTFRVAHSEPTHCRFCGCASIQSFSIVYEDYDTPTIIMHTFTIDMPRSKTYICLRVERDPREIRCIGFNAVTEHQHWFDNVAGWELTDVNMVIGLRRPGSDSDSEATRASGVEVAQTSLVSLKNRPRAREPVEPYQGFIITASDGNLIDYDIPPGAGLASPQASDISYIAKYGYKSVIVNVGRWLEILYLGNDKLIEDDIYYSGNQADVWSILEDQGRKPGEGAPNQTINSELLFINKRARKMRERE
ncbi:hypothetical protein DICA4_F27468 [Diutina catenulata]